MSVPNLDGMGSDELMQFWKRYHRPGRNDAAELIGDRRPGFTALAAKLAGYASNKATAMQCRERGDIHAAGAYEDIAGHIYDDLPADLRW